MNNGKLQVVGKERGRKKSLNKIVDMAAEQAKGWENDIIMITHGDCLEDAEYVAKLVREKMGIDNILINNIGTVIGSIPAWRGGSVLYGQRALTKEKTVRKELRIDEEMKKLWPLPEWDACSIE